jgi:hypothetical protein
VREQYLLISRYGDLEIEKRAKKIRVIRVFVGFLPAGRQAC